MNFCFTACCPDTVTCYALACQENIVSSVLSNTIAQVLKATIQKVSGQVSFTMIGHCRTDPKCTSAHISRCTNIGNFPAFATHTPPLNTSCNQMVLLIQQNRVILCTCILQEKTTAGMVQISVKVFLCRFYFFLFEYITI